MHQKITAVLAVLCAVSTVFLPFMAVGDITTGVFVGVVKKPGLLVFLSPALLVGLIAALGAAFGFPRRRIAVTVGVAVLNLAAFALVMFKLRDGATAGPGLWAMGATPVLAALAALLGRTAAAPPLAR